MNTEQIVDAIYAYHKRRNAGDVHRKHLGASIIGDECARKLFYSFRWASDLSFSGRMFRLFERGRREEQPLIEELRAIGFEVEDVDKDGEQFKFSDFGGHFGGSCDCVLITKDNKRLIGEFKTFGKVQFNALVKHGLRKSKPVHVAQLQTYMRGFGILESLHIAVCKDSDRIHITHVPYDAMIADEMKEKARDIIFTSSPPRKISQDPAFFQCKNCHYADTCHGNKAMKTSCRTCAHSRPLITSGGWFCDLHLEELSHDKQIQACDEWREL